MAGSVSAVRLNGSTQRIASFPAVQDEGTIQVTTVATQAIVNSDVADEERCPTPICIRASAIVCLGIMGIIWVASCAYHHHKYEWCLP